MRLAALLFVLAVSLPAAAQEPTRIPDAALEIAVQLREQALADATSWRVTESLTTEIGARLPGSEADARAVAWAEAKFAELGYDRVWTEPVTFPKWVRRSESAHVVGGYAQPLVVTALGGSPGGEVEAPIVRFANFEALDAAPEGSLEGRIAFVDFQMERTADGSGYGAAGPVRGRGPSMASSKGAVGFLMRSLGTSHARVANTGITRFAEGVEPIPAAALSLPDADQLGRLLQRGEVTVALALDVGFDGEYTSQNVIGEISGSGDSDEFVVIASHLDSWDLGTGAIDDASGVGITMAAGHLIGQLEQRPARSIRVIAFANEEQGLIGARQYAERHADSIGLHLVAAESDFGAGRIYGFNTGAPGHAREATRQIAEALAPLGIEYMPEEGGPGPDIIPMAQAGVTWVWLGQDGTDYFDLHHNANDTLDKVDPADLAQNTAAYAVFAYLAAQAEGDFGSAPATYSP
ncbi:M20/M25/M40 family metallo-hydrolase [Luteimonas sp. A277]